MSKQNKQVLYHFSTRVNEPRPCSSPENCHYGAGTPHYGSPEEYYAQEAAESGNRSVPESRTRSKESPNVDIPYSQRVSAAVARSFQRDDSFKKKNTQSEYDATDIGKLELQRRIAQEDTPEFKQEYIDRLDSAQSHTVNTEGLNLLTEKEKSEASKVLVDSSKNVDWRKLERGSDEASVVNTALVDKSAEWIERLSPEEAEAVSWMTSNGSDVLSAHERKEDHYIWGHEIYSKEHLDKQTSLLSSAFEKAPELDELIAIYRGVNVKNASSLFSVGDEISGRVPKSFSLSSRVAGRFTDGQDEVILKVETKKVASPAAVSAWGASEQEIFSDPNAIYEIVSMSKESFEVKRIGGSAYTREQTIVELVEKQ